jgi:hypothetical protein
MKRIALLVLLALILSACQDSAPAPTPTDTPVPTATFTPPSPTPFSATHLDGTFPKDTPSDAIPGTIGLDRANQLNTLGFAPIYLDASKGGLQTALTKDGVTSFPLPEQIGSSTKPGELLATRIDGPWLTEFKGGTVPPAEIVINKLQISLPATWERMLAVAKQSTTFEGIKAGSVVAVFSDPDNPNTIYLMDAGFGKGEAMVDANGNLLVNGKSPMVHQITGTTVESFKLEDLASHIYAVGLENFQGGYLNQFSVDARLANGIPESQLAAELAYADTHKITGEGNTVGNAVEGSHYTPYKAFPTTVLDKNIISFSEDPSHPGLFEIVYVQANPDGTSKTIVHVVFDPEALSNLVKSYP